MLVFAVLCILSVLCMVVIYGFSCQTAKESEPHGAVVTELVEKIVGEELHHEINNTVRKIGHFLIFALLGVLTYLAVAILGVFKDNLVPPMYVSAVLCMIYAISDEIHQTMVKGRSGRVLDVVVDTAGAVAGGLIAIFVIRALKGMNKKNAGGEHPDA